MSYEMMEAHFTVGVGTGGSNTNGGLFNSDASGVDRTDQDSPQFDLTASGSVTATTEAGDNWYNRRRVVVSGQVVSADDIGNVVQVTSTGSGANVYEGMHRIASVDITGNYWQMSVDVRSSSGDSSPEAVVGKMGGRLADPFFYREKMHVWYSKYYSFRIHLEAGTYTATTGDELSGATFPYREDWLGYTSSRGDWIDGGARPIIDVPSSLSSTSTVLQLPDQYSSSAVFLELRCGGSAAKGLYIKSYVNTATSCVVKDCATTATGSCYYGPGSAFGCSASGGAKYGYFYNIMPTQCSAHDADIGFYMSYVNETCYSCLAVDCTTYGFYSTGDSAVHFGCVAEGCGQGFNLRSRNSTYQCGAANCTTGFQMPIAGTLQNCWAYNNTTNQNATTGENYLVNFQELSSDPFESATDLRINDAAAGGALLAAKGIGFAGGTQTSYSDNNAFVTEPAGSGSTTVVTPGPVQIGM